MINCSTCFSSEFQKDHVNNWKMLVLLETSSIFYCSLRITPIMPFELLFSDILVLRLFAFSETKTIADEHDTADDIQTRKSSAKFPTEDMDQGFNEDMSEVHVGVGCDSCGVCVCPSFYISFHFNCFLRSHLNQYLECTLNLEKQKVA